jgi:hypothetical protein
VVTPIGPRDWVLNTTHGLASLTPSIGNWSYACGSHYLIRRNRVVWLEKITARAIEMGRVRDREQKLTHASWSESRLDSANQSSAQIDHGHTAAPGMWSRIRGAMRRWWRQA